MSHVTPSILGLVLLVLTLSKSMGHIRATGSNVMATLQVSSIMLSCASKCKADGFDCKTEGSMPVDHCNVLDEHCEHSPCLVA